MEVEIIAFGIAKDILKTKKLTIEIAGHTSVAGLKKQLVTLYPEFKALVSLQLAVNASYVEDSYIIQTNDEVVLIPPVSGG